MYYKVSLCSHTKNITVFQVFLFSQMMSFQVIIVILLYSRTTGCPKKNASEIPDLHEKLTKHVKFWKNWENVLSYVVFGGKYKNLCLDQFSLLFKGLFRTSTFENSNRKISFQ